MALFKKKDKTETDLSIVDDYKEPFTWSNFWDEQVVGRFKTIKEFLRENGVLFFLLSPFQYKNRLILKLVLIFLGVMIGVVPRTMTMINTAKERNASSEIANVAPVTSAGDISVSALASGQYDDTHLLVFNIAGDTAKGVPSTTSGFDVTLKPLRGVSDAGNVKYRYKVLPINQTNRLLLVYVDNRKQNDETGIFSLDIHMKNTDGMKTPLEIVLSKGQETTAVYKDGKIRLSELSGLLTAESGTSTTAIKDAQEALDESLRIYKVNEDRLNESGMTLGVTTEKLKEYVDSQLIMTSLTDKSTTDDSDGLDPALPSAQTIASSITYKGETYSDAAVSDAAASNTDDKVANQARDTELPNVSTLVQKVQTAVAAVNSARVSKYTALSNLETVLSQKVTPDDMSDEKTVKE